MEIFDKNNIPTQHCTSSHVVATPTPRRPQNTTPQLTPEQQQQLLNMLLQQAAQQQAQQSQ